MTVTVAARTVVRRGRRTVLHGRLADPAWRVRRAVGSVGRLLRREAHAPLTPTQQAVLDVLRRDAAAVTSIDELAVASAVGLRAAVAEVLPTLAGRESLSTAGDAADGRSTWLHCLALDAPKLAARWPEIVLFGVDPQILALVEGYLGVRPALTSVDLRKDIGTGEQVGTRIWHLDTEDVRNIRMIVYLSDVGDGDGPFEYLPLPVTEQLVADDPALAERAVRAAGDPILDDELATVVPRAQWRRVIGPAGTVAFADNTRLFHHSAVHRSERVALLYTYTSRRPRYPEVTRNDRYDDVLSRYQRASLFTG
jgi:hypothetical protein